MPAPVKEAKTSPAASMATASASVPLTVTHTPVEGRAPGDAVAGEIADQVAVGVGGQERGRLRRQQLGGAVQAELADAGPVEGGESPCASAVRATASWPLTIFQEPKAGT